MVKEKFFLDIIIPVYNAKKTLLRTLCSIALQKNVSNYKVYVIIDCDDCDYSYEKKFVETFLNIEFLRLKKNVGPGQARQYGINHSNSSYIMFIDSDDFLYHPYVLSMIYKVLNNNNVDLINSYFLYHRDNEKIIMKNNNTWLHGKVFNRKFLLDKGIEFNETRANEDNGFNRLVLLNEPKIFYLDSITYYYCENETSITRKNNRSYKFTALKDYCYNINWAIKKSLKTNNNPKLVAITSYALLYSMYYYYNELYDDYDVSKIFEWSKDSLDYYNKYIYLLNNEDKDNIIKKKKIEYENKKIDFKKDFDTFIRKVSEYDD